LSNNNASNRINEVIWNHRERPQLAVAIIEGAARQLGHTVAVDWTSLVIIEKGIHEKTESRILSDQICGLVFPHENAGEFHHYTDMKAFRGIASRFDELPSATFARARGG
jgi:hypothetical protein